VTAVELRDGRSRLVVMPENGGGIARFDALVAGRAPVALLRPWDGAGPLGCELLVPWSNRISGGGFDFDGRFHAVDPNVAGEALPIHGDGFQKPWRVARQSATAIELILDHGSIGPYRYMASIAYELQDGSLNATLTTENRAPIRLPYGLGFHPWFARHPGTLLQAKAERVWLEDERHLPTGTAPVAAHPAWDFSQGQALPAGWINNGFDGWDGKAAIVQPEDGIALSVQASALLDVFIVYSPSPDAGFFCFEPVSHPVDAHHGAGLTVLDPGASMGVTMQLDWRAMEESREVGPNT
jgi:aldose 1-epimerase